MQCSNISCGEETRITLQIKGQALPLCREHTLAFADVILENTDAGSFPHVTLTL